MLQTRNINAVPYGANSSAVEHRPDDGKRAAGKLPSCYRGYGGHPRERVRRLLGLPRLQTALNRRYTAGLRMGVAYTYSDAKNVGASTTQNESDGEPISRRPLAQLRWRRAQAQPGDQLLVRVPGLGRYTDNGIVRAVFGNWQISGVTSALSGATLPLSYSITGISDLTGGSVLVSTPESTSSATRPVTGRSIADTGFRHRVHIAPPSAASNRVGNAVGDEVIGPGYLNWDITIGKTFRSARTAGQFRTELYNAFNNVQFSTVNTAAIFNAAGSRPTRSSASTRGARRTSDTADDSRRLLKKG